MKTLTKNELIDFESKVRDLFLDGKINCPIHLSGGNEDQLISIFNTIEPKDYVISNHRNHYHYLLKGGSSQKLLDEILGLPSGVCGGKSRSMHIYDKSINFLTTAIIGGSAGIACGIGLALKKKYSMQSTSGDIDTLDRPHVWCFVGDGVEDSGFFLQSVRFSIARLLPVTFIIEDNDLAVESTKKDRWHNYAPMGAQNIIRYTYTRRYPHVGVGKHVSF